MSNGGGSWRRGHVPRARGAEAGNGGGAASQAWRRRGGGGRDARDARDARGPGRARDMPPPAHPAARGRAPSAKINIKQTLLTAYKEATSDRGFVDALHQLQRRYRIPLPQLHTCALHIVSEFDDLRLTERLLREIPQDGREGLVNSQQGIHDYTPMCRALYKGSISLVKVLVAAGADVNFTNGHGEGLDNVLESGREAAIAAQPDNRLFIEARFDECRAFLVARRQWLIDQESRAPTAQPWKPRRLRAAGEE